MKDKLYKLLNYFIDQVNSGDINNGVCKNVVKKVKQYTDNMELELSNRELDTITEIRHNEPLRMLLIMNNIYLPLIIQDETIRFLFNNSELMVKNPGKSVSLMLVKLQNLLDFTYFHAEQLEIYREVYTVDELKELQKEINNKWNK